MGRALDDLIDILELEQLEVNLFRGVSPNDGFPRIFGGLVIAQALTENLVLVSNERAFDAYGVARLW